MKNSLNWNGKTTLRAPGFAIYVDWNFVATLGPKCSTVWSFENGPIGLTPRLL